MKNLSGNFFKLKGKTLKPVVRTQMLREKVESLVDLKSYEKTPYVNPVIRFFISTKNSISGNYKFVFPAIAVSFLIFFTFVVLNPPTIRPASPQKYSIYSSKPLTLVQSEQDVDSRDSRAQKINEIFKYYNCPLEGLGEVFVNEADKNDIPWWLVASVAFQESSCGKNTPKIDGQETYNAWGWGVYGNNIHSFDNWARGIEVISAYFKTRFFSQGVTEPCDIMKVYTPSSNGSWCSGVNHFASIIQTYKTP